MSDRAQVCGPPCGREAAPCGSRIARRRRLALAAAALLVLPLAACNAGKEETSRVASLTPAERRSEALLDAQVVATVGGERLSLKSFERYLADNAGDSEEQDPEQTNAIKSRLLDQMIEEKVLERAAKGLGVTVSESEIGDYLSQIGVSEGEAEVGPEGKDAFRDKVRHSLVVQKVKDKAVLSKVEVTPGEVEDYLKKQSGDTRVPRTVVLRQILIDDKSVAERVSAQLAKDPSRFELLARDNSAAPDKGQARAYREDDLPDEIKEAAFQLQRGQVSPVLEYAGRFLILQQVRMIEARDADLGETRRRAQLELFRKKGEQALDRYIADLKKDTPIHVNRAVLPFDYAGEYKN